MSEEEKDREFTNIWEADDSNAFIPKKLIEKAVIPNDPTVEELTKKLDHYIKEASKDDELSLSTFHPGTISAQLDKILHGGLKCGELFTIGLSTPGPYKSDIFRSLYFQKVQRKTDLKAIISKGEATASEIQEAQQELDQLTKALPPVYFHSVSPGEDGLFLSHLPNDIRDMSMGMRAFQDEKGALVIDSYNLIMPDPLDELRTFHRQNMGKPKLAAAVMAMAISANRSVTAMMQHAGHYDSPWPIAEKEESQLAKERKHVPYQHPKKRSIKLSPLLQGLIKQIKE